MVRCSSRTAGIQEDKDIGECAFEANLKGIPVECGTRKETITEVNTLNQSTIHAVLPFCRPVHSVLLIQVSVASVMNDEQILFGGILLLELLQSSLQSHIWSL